MYTASLQISGLSEHIKDLNQKKKDIDPLLKKIATESRNIMKAYIKPRRKASTGTLKRSIRVKKQNLGKGIVSYIVGDIKDLPEYWKVVNYGGYVPPATRGFFGNKQAPKVGGGKDRFHHTAGKNYFIKPNKAIKPMRFIEKTHTAVARKFDSFWKNKF